jgi:hypothetical protein
LAADGSTLVVKAGFGETEPVFLHRCISGVGHVDQVISEGAPRARDVVAYWAMETGCRGGSTRVVFCYDGGVVCFE